MAVTKKFLDRFIEKVEDVDANSRQAYILRLMRERGFFETVFNAVEEGILVLDEQGAIRYHNRAADELLGPVGRTVVDDYELEIAVCLGQGGVNGP